MSDQDIEQLLRRALEAEAVNRVPDTRVSPDVRWPGLRTRRRAWLAPMAVAAGVVLLTGVVYAGFWHRPVEPPVVGVATTSATATRPTPAATAPTPSDPGTEALGSAVPPTASSSGRLGTTVTVGGAVLALPVGWSVTQDLGTALSRAINPTWCIDPSGQAGCTVMFTPLSGDVDADLEGGILSNPEYCGPGQLPASKDYSEPSLGGRAAEYRYWHYDCADGRTFDIAQYTVMTPQAYILWSEKATVTVRGIMQQIATASTLPPATSSVRLYDHGIVKAVSRLKDGSWEMTLDRVVGGRPNTSAATYAYRTTSSVQVADSSNHTAIDQLVGRTVAVFGDGRTVHLVIAD